MLVLTDSRQRRLAGRFLTIFLRAREFLQRLSVNRVTPLIDDIVVLRSVYVLALNFSVTQKYRVNKLRIRHYLLMSTFKTQF